MNKLLSKTVTMCTSLAAASLLLGACNQDADMADSALLDYVAADTPYLFAALAPTPDDVREKLEPRMDRVMSAYRGLLRSALRDGLAGAEMSEEGDEEAMERVTRVLDELIGMLSMEEMRNAGIGDDATAVFYGVGLVPVLRFTLDDTAAFEAKLAEIEAEAGASMGQREIGGGSFRFVGDDKAMLVVSLQAGQAVISLMPSGLSDASVAAVLGFERPATSMASGGRLSELADRYGYTAHGAGYVDFVALAETFLSEQQGANAELLQMIGFDRSQLSAACQAEFRELAGVMPRLVTGYTGFTAEEITSHTVLELRNDIAAGLTALTAPVPGLGADRGGMVSLGASIDLLAAREFYGARLDAIEADPWECEHLAQSNMMVAQGRAALEQPLPPMVYGVKGFLAVVEDIEGLDMATKQPPTSIDMQFLLATDNAPGLVAMGSMFSPELATLNLQPDGQPVRFESPQLQPPIDDVHVAMTTSALALSVGEGGEAKLPGMLAADPGSPPPFFSMHMDAGRYYKFIGEASRLQQGEDASPEVTEYVGDLMEGLSDIIDRVSVDVLFTERGVEFPAVTTLAE